MSCLLSFFSFVNQHYFHDNHFYSGYTKQVDHTKSINPACLLLIILTKAHSITIWGVQYGSIDPLILQDMNVCWQLVFDPFLQICFESPLYLLQG